MIRPLRLACALSVVALVAVLLVAAPTPAASQSKPHAVLVGDSVLEMICEHAPAELDGMRQLFDVTCDGRDVAPFRTTSDGYDVIRSHAALAPNFPLGNRAPPRSFFTSSCTCSS